MNVTDPGLAVASVSWSDAVAADNTGSLSVSSDIVSGSNFTVGVTTVTYNTTDPSGNPSTCSFTVTISGKMHVIYSWDENHLQVPVQGFVEFWQN